MKTSHELFELIKSLDKSEKRYFRLYSSLQSGSKNYVLLFNLIDRMNSYDELDLKKKFKRLTFTKQYLYNTILKSLKSYNSDGTSKTRMYEQLIKLRILYHKSLIKQFYRNLTLLKQKAKDIEDFNLYHDLLKLEIQSIKTGEYKDADQIKLLKEINSTVIEIKNLNEYALIAMTIHEHTRLNGMIRDRNSFNKISAIMDNSLIKKKESITSIREKELYHKVMSNYLYVTGDMKQMIDNNLTRLEIVNNNMRIFEEDIALKQIEIYGPILYGAIKLSRFDDFKFYFNKLKLVKARTNLEKATKFSKMCMYEFLYLLKIEEFHKGVELIKSAEEGFRKYEGSIQKDDILISRYYMCRLYFGAQRFEEALRYSNDLLNHQNIAYRSDVHTYSRLLNLIIHFELGNYELLPYIIKSVYRYLFRHGKIYKFEKIILKFLKSLRHTLTEDELNERLIFLREELMQLNNDPFEKNVFIYMELISWIERKTAA